MAVRWLQRSWNKEPPVEQGPGAYCRAGTTRFKETRVERWCGKKGLHEFARFAATLLLLPFACLLRSLLPQSNQAILSARTCD